MVNVSTVTSAILTLIIIAILFSAYSAIVPEAQAAGNEFGDSNRCSEAGGFFNSTQDLCLNGTSPADTATISFRSTPLATLFSSTGVVFLLVMAALIFLIIKGILPNSK